MAEKTYIYLIELFHPPKEAFEILAKEASFFGDNGGDPDGDRWLIEEDTLSEGVVDELMRAGVARRVRGFKITPYIEPSNYTDWCGYSGNQEAFTTDEGTANAIFGDIAGIEESIPNPMNVGEAEKYAREIRKEVTGRGIRFAARRGYISGARKLGRDWLIPYEGLRHYLYNRPKRGPK